MSPQPEIQPSNYTLTCRMAFEPAALERLCQVVRIRGFKIASMAADSVGGYLDITVTLEGNRPIAMLRSQLEKLHTVVEVVLTGETLAHSKAG